MKLNDDLFNTLRKIHNNPEKSQRELAGDMGFSLGKMNYCLNELKKKGLIKISNFKKNPKKLRYIYLLTPNGISIKTKLTINFMKKNARI